MGKFDQCEIFKEASLAKRKFKPIIIILFFILIFDIGSGIQGILCIPFISKWAFELLPTVNEVMENGSFSEMFSLAAKMPPYVMIPTLFATVGTTIVSIIYVTKIERRSLSSMGFFKKKLPLGYPMGYLIGGMIMILSALVCLIFKGIDIVGGKINYLIILYFLGYIVQGMSEEVLCRGFFLVSLKNSMKNKHATLIAVLVSSIAFALLHSVNPGMTLLAMFNLFLSGLFFALLMLRFDNIWVPCAAHSAWNFFQGHVLGSQVSGLESQSSFLISKQVGNKLFHGGSFGFEGSLAIMIVLIIGITILFVIPGNMNKGGTK